MGLEALRGPRSIAFLGGAVGGLALISVSGLSTKEIVLLAILLAFVSMILAARPSVIGWDRVVALILVIVFFVPMGRYQLPGSLPFNLELYRLVVALCVLVWASSLLVDPSVRLAHTAFDRPLALILICVLGSEITNPGRVNAYGSHVIKSLMFFLSFVLVYYLTATTIKRRSTIDSLLKLMTVCAAVVGVFAVYESRAHYNVFDHLHTVLPFLRFNGPMTYLKLGANLRVFGPSEQPIALGATMILLLPLAIYFARRGGRRWWFVAVLILLGAFASGSRTAMIMLVVQVIVFLALKPKETKKLWPAVIPALAVIHLMLPGTIGSLKEAFFPKGGLIAQQSKTQADYNKLLAGGRISLIRPMLSEVSGKPLFGEGYGTRITGFNTLDRNAPILDNQWLNNVMDVGFIGLGAWIWFFVRTIRRLSRASRTAADDDDSWLFACFTAGVTSFGLGMLTFDAFSFTQAIFLFWVVLAISAAALRLSKSQLTSDAATVRANVVWLA